MPRSAAMTAASLAMLTTSSLGAIIPVKAPVFSSTSSAPNLATTADPSSDDHPFTSIPPRARLPHIPIFPDYANPRNSSLTDRLLRNSTQPSLQTITAAILMPQTGHSPAMATSTVRPLPSSESSHATTSSSKSPNEQAQAKHPSENPALDARTDQSTDESDAQPPEYPKYPKIYLNTSDIDIDTLVPGVSIVNANASTYTNTNVNVKASASTSTNTSRDDDAVSAGAITLQLDDSRAIVVPFSEEFVGWLANGTTFTVAQDVQKVQSGDGDEEEEEMPVVAVHEPLFRPGEDGDGDGDGDGDEQ